MSRPCPKCAASSMVPSKTVTGGLFCGLCGHTCMAPPELGDIIAASVANMIGNAPPQPILRIPTPPACGWCGRWMMPVGVAGGKPSWACVHPDATVHTSYEVP